MGKVNIILVLVAVTLVSLVLGLSSFNEQAEAGIIILPPPTGDCGSFGVGITQHWDKIIFKVDQRLINSFPSPAFPSILKPILSYDIKVEQDPISATNLERAVSDFLNSNGYKTLDGKKVRPLFISIVDVEYSITCPFTGLPVVDVDMDGFSPPEDCDDDDPLVNPGATEVCNGKDDDCDKLIDEGLVCNGATDGGAMSNYLPLSINPLGFK